MSTSLLYHGFGLVGYEYVRTQYAGGAVILFIKRRRGKFRCSFCRSRNIILRGTIPRRFRIVPIGSKKVFLDYEVQFRCAYVVVEGPFRSKRGELVQ